MPQYLVRVTGDGEVRDADGNLKDTIPINDTQVMDLTEEQYRALTEGDSK